jgi:hypothetical protein
MDPDSDKRYRLVLDPNSRMRILWNFLLIIFILYSATMDLYITVYYDHTAIH